MTSKIANFREAVSLVEDSDTIGLGGMTIYRRPVSFVKALLLREQPPHDLTLLAFTASIAADLLVGSGLIKRVRTCYFGLESFGLAPMYTAAASGGDIEVIEESEASIANGIRAQMAGTGYMPSQAWQGTDMFKVRPDVKQIVDPYSGKQLTAFPAIHCNIAVLHVLRADAKGNCILGGNPTIDSELAAIADKVIITAEEIVEDLSENVDIVSHDVDLVVEAPGGAWPTSCYPLYPVDGEEIMRYIECCNRDEFDLYLRNAS